jgi:hypothetical protein
MAEPADAGRDDRWMRSLLLLLLLLLLLGIAFFRDIS